MKREKKEEEIEESWDKKRVGIAVIVLIIILGGLFYLVENNFHFFRPQDEKVLSAKDVKLEDIVQNQVVALKRKASEISVDEIASSSPEIQTLIRDLQALQNYPKNKAKEACFKICDGF